MILIMDSAFLGMVTMIILLCQCISEIARAKLEMEDVAGARSELTSGPESGGGFLCSACGQRTEAWSGRCPSCGGWDTFGAA